MLTKLKLKFRDWLNNADIPANAKLINKDPYTMDLDRSDSIHFTLWIANGGQVIQTSKYSKKQDRHVYGLYVIHHDQNLGKEIEKIITIDSLKVD